MHDREQHPWHLTTHVRMPQGLLLVPLVTMTEPTRISLIFLAASRTTSVFNTVANLPRAKADTVDTMQLQFSHTKADIQSTSCNYGYRIPKLRYSRCHAEVIEGTWSPLTTCRGMAKEVPGWHYQRSSTTDWTTSAPLTKRRSSFRKAVAARHPDSDLCIPKQGAR